MNRYSVGVLPANGANSASTRKSAGNFARRTADQRLDAGGLRIGGFRGFDIAERLLDAADPVDRLSASPGLRTTARRKHSSADSSSFSSTVKLAELLVELGILRPFLDQLRQKQLGHEVLLRGHQGLHQIGARRPMARIQRQRLQIERDGVVGISRPEIVYCRGCTSRTSDAAPAAARPCSFRRPVRDRRDACRHCRDLNAVPQPCPSDTNPDGPFSATARPRRNAAIASSILPAV